MTTRFQQRHVRPLLAAIVLVTTIVVFVVYFKNHPETLTSLRNVPVGTLALLLVLYGVFIATLVWIQRATLDLCNIRLPRTESALLVMYSSIINFFGPLQSGPGFRAAYLKKKHNVSLKKYSLATLVYYGLYAVFSGLLLASFVFGLWVGALCLLTFAGAPIVLRLRRFSGLPLRPVLSLAMATLAQVMTMVAIYFVALQSILPQVSLLQSLAYTGAANFALFVSITPGAIGFRESFLLFSQKLHGIGSDTIAVASVIDRSVYIALLVGMAIGIFGLHANKYFKNVSPLKTDKKTAVKAAKP